MVQPVETIPEQPAEVKQEQSEAKRAKVRADEAREDASVGTGRQQPQQQEPEQPPQQESE